MNKVLRFFTSQGGDTAQTKAKLEQEVGCRGNKERREEMELVATLEHTERETENKMNRKEPDKNEKAMEQKESEEGTEEMGGEQADWGTIEEMDREGTCPVPVLTN